MITDNILLGGREDAENAAQLIEYGVTHVLDTAQQLPNYFPQHFVYLKVGLLGTSNKQTSLRYKCSLYAVSVSFLFSLSNRRNERKCGGGDGECGEFPVARGARAGARAAALSGRGVPFRLRAADAPDGASPSLSAALFPLCALLPATDQPERGLQIAAGPPGGAGAALLLCGQGRRQDVGLLRMEHY